jgi:hypothetical protein
MRTSTFHSCQAKEALLISFGSNQTSGTPASKVAQLEELRQPASREEVLQELRATREALIRLERRLEAEEGSGKRVPAKVEA